MISIRNTQRTVQLDITHLEKMVQHVLDELDYSDFDIGIWFTSDKTIREYNKQYRNKDKPTDILSFPFHTELNAGERIEPEFEDDKNLGDIIISCAYVQRSANELGIPFDERMKVLLVHGICHLLGYDHISDADFEVMSALESKLIDSLSSI